MAAKVGNNWGIVISMPLIRDYFFEIFRFLQQASGIVA